MKFQEAESFKTTGKTEVSMLTELLAKRGKEADYEVFQVQGEGITTTMFTYNVTFADVSATATAPNKKQAKRLAARNLLETMGVDCSRFETLANDQEMVDGRQVELVFKTERQKRDIIPFHYS